MKTKNSKEVNKGYWKFSGYLVTCAFVGITAYFCYTKTAEIEVNRIVEKAEEYDKIYVQQMELVNRIDSLYRYISLFNTNLNDAHLQHAVSRKKQEILSSTEIMNSRDVRIYRKLMEQVNVFLGVKDSIRLFKIEEDLVKADLLKCVEENKQATRKLTIGGITVNK